MYPRHMSYEEVVRKLSPVMYSPLEYIDFDGVVTEYEGFNVSAPVPEGVVTVPDTVVQDVTDSIDMTATTGYIDFSTVTFPPAPRSFLLWVRVAEGQDPASQTLLMLGTTEIGVTVNAGGQFSVFLDLEESPPMDPGYWYAVSYANGVWFSREFDSPLPFEFDTQEGVAARMQFVAVFDYTLSPQEVDDAFHVAEDGSYVRRVNLSDTIAIGGDSVTSLQATWHIISV